MSTLSKFHYTAEQTQKNLAKFTQFRILVIGRANAGKTTILRRLCNATGEPVIFSPDGEKIKSTALDPCLKRGQHNIEDQMIFKSNPGFIFHDSPGFEAGSAQELKLVQKFIKRRSRARNMNDQLHAIWYCIPTSDDRPITKAENIFFNECGTGLVPVIVLWTKTDSLDLAKIKQLMKEGNSKFKAMQQAPQKAWADFEKNIYKHFDGFKYPPKAFVVFRNMHEPGADCKDLIDKTTAALSSEDLQQLFLSTQQNNAELCIKYGVKKVMDSAESVLWGYFKNNKGNWACFMAIVLRYFPPFVIYDDLKWWEKLFDYGLKYGYWWKKISGEFKWHDLENLTVQSISKIMSSTLSGLSTAFNLKEAIYCAIVAAILGHLAFFLKQESIMEKNSLERAAQVYQQSTCDTSVKQAVENLFEDSHVDHALLVKQTIQITLDNLLLKI